MAVRVALVIGNSGYQHAPELPNPRNDATAIANALKSLQFAVTVHTDLTCNHMEDELHRFGEETRGADAALFFFAGHGIQVNGENYLIPTDAQLETELHLRRRTFSLTEILESMEQRARNSILFLDACRDSPFARSFLPNDQERARDIVRGGLAELRPQANRSSFIAFATAPNTVAYDGTGSHSPFTQALLENITTPNVSVADMMVEVRRSVRKATRDRQIPWDQSSLQERFCFKTVEETNAKRTAQPGAVPGGAAHADADVPFNKRQKDIFVHCTSNDWTLVGPLVRWLSDFADLTVLSEPRQLRAHERMANISAGFASVRAALICVSRTLLASAKCEDEIKAAMDQSRADRRYRIIALALDDCEIPSFLADVPVLDMKTFDAGVAAALLEGLVANSPPWLHGQRDVYVSRSWHVADMEIADWVCSALIRRHGFRLIGDSPDYAIFDPNVRLKRIIDSCGALVALFPYRDDVDSGFTSKFMVKEVLLAREIGRPYLLFAAEGVKLDASLISGAFGARVLSFPRSPDDPMLVKWLSDFDEHYQPSPRPAYSFFASSLLKEAPENTRAVTILQQITSMECLVGQRLQGQHAQQDIIDRIRDAEFVLADISENNHNSLIEAGIARGTGTRLHLMSSPGDSGELRTRFMLRDLEINWYRDPLERIGTVHRIARKYRRRVINPGVG